jgi:hypothetical protein
MHERSSEPELQPNAEPPPEAVVARRQLINSPVGRLGRLRSWLTVLVGVLALLALAIWIGSTY